MLSTFRLSLVAFLAMWTAGCGDLGAKKSANPVETKKFSLTLGADFNDLDFKQWKQTFAREGKEDIVASGIKGQTSTVILAEDVYRITLELSDGNVIVASNAIPPCQVTEQTVSSGAKLSFPLCSRR